MLGLVIFRILWGFIGSHYARFSQFVSRPSKVADYAKTLLQKDTKPYAGHNPLGGWSALVLLLLISLQAVSGLFVSDDIFSEGPYRALANQSVIDVMEFIHTNVFTLLLGAVAVHVAAVLFYQLYKRQPIIAAMIHGKKPTHDDSIKQHKLVVALISAVIIACLVYVLVDVLPPEPEFYY